MAKYRLKKMVDGRWRVWARYQPFKGAATQSHIVYATRAELGPAVDECAKWVETRRAMGSSRKNRASKPSNGGNL